MNENLKALNLLLSDSENIVITVHKSPDGDAMGSSLALYNHLCYMGYKVHVITPNPYADFLKWLPGNKNVVIYSEQKNLATEITNNADLIFMLDFGQLYRLDTYSDIVKRSNSKKVMIDHHQEPDLKISDIQFINVKASATAEIIYEIFENLNWHNLINKDVATCLYTAIMTDTGSFKYPSTTKKTHRIIANLIHKGAKNSLIHDLVYDHNSEDKIKLLGYCLNNKLLVYKENNAAIISLNQKELNDFRYKDGDTEGIVNYALSIKNIIFAVFIIEKDGMVKLSLRSKGNFKVNDIAKKYFKGGGHNNAAGGISDVSIKKTINNLKEIFMKYNKQLNNTKI